MNELLLSAIDRSGFIRPGDVGYNTVLSSGEKELGQQTQLIPDEANGYIYVIGGYNNASGLNKDLFRYTVATGAWTTLAPFPGPEPRHLGAVLLDGKLFCMRNGIVYEYTIATNTWVTGARGAAAFQIEMPTASIVGKEIYYFGYPTDYSTYGVQMVAYHTETKVWRQLARLRMLPLWAYPMATRIGDRIYIVGGESPATGGWVYSITANTYTAMTLPRNANASNNISKGRNLYLASLDNTFAGVWKYNTMTGEATNLPDLPRSLTYSNAICRYGNKLYYSAIWPTTGSNKKWELYSYQLVKDGDIDFPANLGPGPTTLQFGDVNAGYFGEIEGADLITYTALMAAHTPTQGSASPYTSYGWWKFIFKGKILYIAKQAAWKDAPWQALQGIGLDVGKAITIGGNPYLHRLISVDAVNPTNIPPNQVVAAGTYPGLDNSEWGKLVLNMISPDAGGTGLWGNLTKSNLNWTAIDSVGMMTVVKERRPNSTTQWMAIGGFNGARYTYMANANSAAWHGHRPVLELGQ